MRKFFWLTYFSFLMAATALAADQAAATGQAAPSLVNGIVSAVIGGVMAVFLGYGKNRNAASGEMEKFDIKYAWPTLIIGGLVGVGSYFMKKTPADLVASLEASPLYAGVIFAVEAAWKAIWRNSAPMIREALGAIKSGKENPTNPQ